MDLLIFKNECKIYRYLCKYYIKNLVIDFAGYNK